MTHTLAPDLDGAELERIGVYPTPLARRALADARHERLDAWFRAEIRDAADRRLGAPLATIA